MSSFTDPLVVIFLGKDRWMLAEEFDYRIGSEDSNRVIHCPKGMQTDFASIPKIFWNILSPYGKWGKAAIVHDYLYQTKGMGGELTRKDCDDIFLEAMGVLGVNWFTRHLMYRAVRCFAKW